eukprot:CAMPEP_0113716300 /NCGR_PEP_ID=MMETSP0038_2-20120614/33818_1 /TAXON_ID=2898 /ORGANISM="Cryptomonas paramecium" /LENGTH=151 /DNA_ID=CAMNT_0000643817 /DNA_START=145 /DNA_END=597 /DNA_ORIENTATION=- /assembly_acc=CAM_ASM_000170
MEWGYGDETEASRVPTLLALSERALLSSHDKYRILDGVPPESAARILSVLQARGDLTLRILLKFASVPLESLDLTGSTVTDQWMPLIASFPLTELNLSLNPAVTDEGIACLVGNIRGQPLRPRRRDQESCSPPSAFAARSMPAHLHRSKSD